MKRYAEVLPELGEVVELLDKDGLVCDLGVVYGLLPKEKAYLVRKLKLDDEGRVIKNENN